MHAKLDITHGGEALDHNMVSKYTDDLNLSTDAKYRMEILTAGYSICFSTIVIILPMFVIMAGKSFESIVANRQRSGDWTKSKCILVSFTLTIFVIDTLALVAEFEQLSLLDNGEKITFYSKLKTVFLCILVLECVAMSTVYCCIVNHHREDNQICAPILFRWFSLCSLSFLFSTILLGMLPLILLIFAYPIYTSALIMLHYTMIYSLTSILAIVIHCNMKMVEHCSGIMEKNNSVYNKKRTYKKW